MRRIATLISTLALLACGAAASPAAAAEQVTLLLSGRTDMAAGGDVFAVNYGSLDGFLGSPASPAGAFSGLNVGGGYQVRGFDIYQGKPYLLLGARADQAAGQDLFVISYDSLGAFLSSPASAPGAFTGINISSGYEVGGFDIYNGKPYLLLGGRTDQGAGQDLFVVAYDSLAAFQSSPAGAPGVFTPINVSSGYRVAGFDIYNDQPYLLLGSRTDQAAGQDLFVVRYDTLNAFLNSPASPAGAFTGLNVGAGYEIADFAIVGDSAGGVPEPSTWALLIAGFGLTGATLRRRRLRTAVRAQATAPRAQPV